MRKCRVLWAICFGDVQKHACGGARKTCSAQPRPAGGCGGILPIHHTTDSALTSTELGVFQVFVVLRTIQRLFDILTNYFWQMFFKKILSSLTGTSLPISATTVIRFPRCTISACTFQKRKWADRVFHIGMWVWHNLFFNSEQHWVDYSIVVWYITWHSSKQSFPDEQLEDELKTRTIISLYSPQPTIAYPVQIQPSQGAESGIVIHNHISNLLHLTTLN